MLQKFLMRNIKWSPGTGEDFVKNHFTSKRLLSSESSKEPPGKIKQCGNGNGFLLLCLYLTVV